MTKTGIDLLVLTISQVLLMTVLVGKCDAQPKLDGDWPSNLEIAVENTRDGNPLDEGDHVYSLRGGYRLFSGNLGLEASLAYAEPTSPFVRGLGSDSELLLLDFSVVWYANYKYLNEVNRKSGKPWHRNSRIKPELIVFAGPGFASLRIKDAFPTFPLSDASKDFFTVNFGIGTKLHWLEKDPDTIWEYSTSRLYFRPELRARWFAGDADGNLDWGISLALGYTFGNRPSRLALQLQCHEICKEVDRYLVSTKVTDVLASAKQSIKEPEDAEKADTLHEKMVRTRQDVELTRARWVACGDKCRDRLDDKSAKLYTCLNESIDKLNDAISQLRPSTGAVD